MSLTTPASPASKLTKSVPADVARCELEARIRDLQQRAILQRKLVGACCLATGCALALSIVAVSDFFLEIALPYRTAWFVGLLMVSSAAIFLGWKRWIASYTLSQAAVDAERQLEQLGQRLRTTLDYDQPDRHPAAASPVLVAALQRESHQVAERTDWDGAIDGRPLVKAFSMAAVVACVGIVGLMASPEFRISAARALLLPSEYTTVTYSPQTTTIRSGESVTVKADVTGRPIRSAQLRYRPAGSQDNWQTLDLVPADEEDSSELLHGPLETTLEKLGQDMEFEVVAGPRVLPLGSIRVLQPLTLEKSRFHITPPEYTGKSDETVESLDLKVLEGSHVEFTLELNRPAGEAKLVWQGHDSRRRSRETSDRTLTSSATSAEDQSRVSTEEIPLTIDGNLVRGTLNNLRTNGAFSFSAQAADGISLEPVRFNIRVQMDRKPQVRFSEPSEELVVTPTTEVPLLVEADDDLGLFKVGVMYQISGGPMETLLEQNADGSTELFRLPSALLLEQHPLSHQDAVNYYAFAEDNYFGQPRRTTTPLRFIDIRPFKLAFQLLDTGGT